MGADWTLLPYLRALGLVGRSPLEAEVAQLEATKQRLEAQVSEGDPEVAAMHAAVEGPRERRAEAGRRLADTFGPHLDVYNEKAQQAQGVDAMSGVVEKHIQKVEGYNEERGEMYGYKAHYLHSAAVVMSQLSDKVNLGFPFAQDLHALNSIAPSPVPDPVHEAVVDSMRSVAQVGAPTFPALCSSFSKMSDALFPSGGGGPAVAALGAEGAKELEGKFRHASEKLEGRAVSAAIKAVEGLADEMSLLGGGAERNIRAWHHGATQYSVAQQGLHFLSCEMSMQRFSVCVISAGDADRDNLQGGLASGIFLTSSLDATLNGDVRTTPMLLPTDGRGVSGKQTAELQGSLDKRGDPLAASVAQFRIPESKTPS